MTCIITTKTCNQDFQRANRSSPTIIAFYKNWLNRHANSVFYIYKTATSRWNKSCTMDDVNKYGYQLSTRRNQIHCKSKWCRRTDLRLPCMAQQAQHCHNVHDQTLRRHELSNKAMTGFKWHTMGGTRNLKLGGGNVGARARAQGAMEIGVWGLWAKCRPGLELPGVGGLNPHPQPSSCLHTLIFEQKSALNFDPWAKFQTFRHLSVLEVSIIIISATYCHITSWQVYRYFRAL